MNKTDKVKEVQRFIDENPEKDLTWCAANNGLVSRSTFFIWKKRGMISTNAGTNEEPSSPNDLLLKEFDDLKERFERLRPSIERAVKAAAPSDDDLVKDILKEADTENLKAELKEWREKYALLQMDYVFERQMRLKWENLIHDAEANRLKMEEYKRMYEKLQAEYVTLKSGSRGTHAVKTTEKPKEWWEDMV